jgi:hypothetical protein
VQVIRPTFEDFLLFWRTHVDRDSPLYHCADAVWHELHWGSALPHLKQRFGLLSWVLWWAHSAFLACRSDYPAPIYQNSIHSPVFALLGPPAHLASLIPIKAQLAQRGEVLVVSSDHTINADEIISIPEQAPDFGTALTLLRSTILGVSLTRRYLRRHHQRCGIFLLGRLAQRIFACLNAITRWERLPNPTGPLFLTYELLPWQKGLVSHWRRAGQRVIHVMHGQRLDFYQHTNATDMVLFSKIDEPWFRARVDPSIRIWTIGHPRLEDVRRKVGPAHSHHARLPRITFFSQPSEGDYTRELRLADWRICASLKGRAEVRFRAHPREHINMIKTDMAAAKIDFMQISDQGLIEDLSWCDAVASSWSTVSMEAAACGRGIFWTCSTPERYEASQELRDHGIGILIQSANHWEKPLAEWQSGEWREPVRVSDTRLRELGMIGEMDKSWVERLGIAS